MHLTWQPGDPVVQLNFPNPLNVSVQVGDVAYFSNPNPVGQVQEWAATTTPHLSNPQSGVIMIGEIIQIIPWNGTVSSIICQMPQDLFNQYFAQIVAGGCPTSPAICFGDCDRIDPRVGIYNIAEQLVMPNDPSLDYVSDNIAAAYCGACTPANEFFFDNPTFHVDDYKFPDLTTLTNTNIQTLGYCEILNSDPYYHPGWYNYYRKVTWFKYQSATTSSVKYYTANEVLNALMTDYPSAGFSLGMTFHQANLLLIDFSTSNTTITTSYIRNHNNPVTGNCIENPEVLPCTQGSFIMFSKDNKVNMSDMLGYYASVELRNNSKTEAELFNVGTTFFESSK